MATGDAGELVTYARTDLLARIRGAEQRVWLASPFLSKPVAEEIATAVEESSAGERRLLTALVAGSVQTRVLDPSALELLRDSSFEICSVPNLHAKLSLIDESWGLVGSGNLTNSGLGSEGRANVELGVILDAGQIASAGELFARWWDGADPIGAGVLAEYAALPRLKRAPGQPVSHGEPIGVGLPQSFEDLLGEDALTANGRGYWVKANYQRQDDQTWWNRGWISDRRQASYAIGDLIVLYLSAKDDGPAICPAVVRVTEQPQFARDWIAEHGDPEAAQQWPYRTMIEVVGDVPIESGAGLEEFGLSGQSLQSGYCSITRQQFEEALRAMGVR
jgi:PLD-like domain